MANSPRPGWRAVAWLTAISGLLVLLLAYPFLPGGHDPLAVPLSTMVQVFGVVGMALVPVGLLWLAAPGYAFALSVIAMVVSAGVVLVLALFATLSVGPAFGALTLASLGGGLAWCVTRLRRLSASHEGGAAGLPMSLVLLPTLVLGTQLAIAGPATRWSRDRAIANAAALISDIEGYRQRHGSYPGALQAQHRDYVPGIVGVDQYRYLPRGDSYNLSFEQPRFLLDRFGTREWLVYNPHDEQRSYSHTAALLDPTAAEPNQGWYASGDTGRAHWRYFWFD